MNNSGKVVKVNGNMVSVEFDGEVLKNEVGYIHIGDSKLKGEVIRINGSIADMQIFESTSGLAVGDSVTFTKELLAVELGPGLLGQIYDGLQNPLPRLAEGHRGNQRRGDGGRSGAQLSALPPQRFHRHDR